MKEDVDPGPQVAGTPARSQDGEQTKFGKWLISRGLSAYVGRSYDLGFYDWPDLGRKEEDAKESAAAIVEKKADHLGDYNRILNGWRDRNATQSETKPLDLPELPKGATFDLSKATVDIDDVTYKIPTDLSTTDGGAKVVYADNLNASEWLVLARRTRLLYAVYVDAAFSSHGAEAHEAALLWRVPIDYDFLDSNDSSEVRSDLSYTSVANSLAANHMVAANAGLQFPYVSAAVKASREEKSARSDLRKRLRMTGQWLYPRAALHHLDRCTSLSPAFIEAIQEALDSPDAARSDALDGVFRRFGNAYPTVVVVGGGLYFVSERDTSGNINTSEVKRTLEAAVSVKAGVAGAQGGVNFADGENKETSAQDIAEATSFKAIGGDTTLASNPSKWSSTVKDANNWRVIHRREFGSLIDRLPDPMRESVKTVWNQRVQIMWDGLTPPREYVGPDLDGRPFTITHLPTGYSLALNKAQGKLRVAARAELSDPERNGLLWRLFYSGDTTEPNGRGAAKYWVAAFNGSTKPPMVEHTHDGLDQIRRWRAGVFPVDGSQQLATTFVLKFPHVIGRPLPFELAPAQAFMSTEGGTGTTFTFTPADPGGQRGEAFKDAYVIRGAGLTTTLGVDRSGPSFMAVNLDLGHRQAGDHYDVICWACRPVEV